MKHLNFSWADYALFILMLVLSVIIGIYYGCFGKKQETTADYLLGGKKMKVFPVAMSLVASSLSGVSLLAMPAEVYLYGTQFMMMTIGFLLMGIIVNYIFMPVFWNLQITTIFEYLERRFDKRLRVTASILFTLSNFIFLPTVIYAPALALNQVTGFNLHIISVFMVLICVFYTTIGGLKAVVSADTLQFSITLCTLGCVFVMGTVSVGGFGAIWEKAKFGDRIEFFNMNPDPTVRTTFWNMAVGGIFSWTAHLAVNPATAQRLLAVSSLNDSRKVLVIFVVFTIITKIICCFFGLIMYAKYYNCDPLSAGYMRRADQILPFYVLDVAAQIPGLSGLFIAGLFSCGLSTLSTFLNSLSGVFYTDFIAPFMPTQTSEKKSSNIMKLITIILGCVSVALIFVIERLGTIMEMVASFAGITMGPLLGLFTMGMLFPIANKEGALVGVTSSLCIIATIAINYQINIWNGAIKHIRKPFYTYGCNVTATFALNQTYTSTTIPAIGSQPEVFWLFRISFYYYVLIGTLITLLIGLPASWITRDRNHLPNNINLLSPCIHRFINRYPKPGLESAGREFRVFKISENEHLKEMAESKLLN